MIIILIISIILNFLFISFYIWLWFRVACLSAKNIKLENNNEEHTCNNCRIMFIVGKELNYKYCPYCGDKLTLHSHNSNFKKEE